jgi:hypothetical protein
MSWLKPRPPVYGLVAEFDGAGSLLKATERAAREGFVKMEAYSPFPIDGLAEALGFRRTFVPLIVLLGGIAGGLGGFFMQWFSATIHYPVNAGGRPFNSWPSFVPVTFELTILLASVSALLGMLALNRLPMPYHPLFNVTRFNQASQDRFFLCIEATDPKFDAQTTRNFLESLEPTVVYEVDH